MKKVGLVIFCMLSVFLLAIAGNVAAYNAAYTHSCYYGTTPTVNGWYTSAEWAASTYSTLGEVGLFRDQWSAAADFSVVYENLMIETTDATDDAGDYWQICFDSTEVGADTPPDGGTAPKTNDYRIDITGHGASQTVTWYKGSGTAWTQITASAALFTVAQSLNTSIAIPSQHYILELSIDKSSTALGTVIMGYNWAMRVAYYDAHTGGNGLVSWPPASSVSVPNEWGYVPYVYAANDPSNMDFVLPESLTIAVVIVLSSVAVIGGSVLLRKRSIAKIASKRAVTI